ncbi:hypothetical protein SBRY_10431 [Actinacidiphila bryophytorum]|uniref:Uncharacterized protein n=1 Tax=Actinacidiphila bryophytorum TaxID=1436133 RepID=A0A9W4E2X3_9ACTN|nr:hypothetical protein SBRY_10431 [Actinacidiphila bryophytorum]
MRQGPQARSDGPGDPARRCDLRVSGHGRGGARGAGRGFGDQRGLGGDGLPGRPGRAAGQARRHRGRGRRGRGRDRHGHRPRRLPVRPLHGGLRGDPCGQAGLRPEGRDRRPPEGDLRERRAVDVRQHPPLLVAGDAGGRGLHQDLDRQGRGQCHAREHAADAGGGARLPRGRGGAGRGQAGRRHQDVEGRDQVPGDGQRNARRRLAVARMVPLRRLKPAQRPADAAAEAQHRPVFRSRLRHGGLTHGQREIRLRTRAGVPRDRRSGPVLRAVHRR